MSTETVLAKHAKEQVCEVGSTREYISPLLAWDTHFNIHIQEENKKERLEFSSIFNSKLFSGTGDQSGILQLTEDEKKKKSHFIIEEVFVPVMDNYGITLFYKCLKDMRMLSTKQLSTLTSSIRACDLSQKKKKKNLFDLLLFKFLYFSQDFQLQQVISTWVQIPTHLELSGGQVHVWSHEYENDNIQQL